MTSSIIIPNTGDEAFPPSIVDTREKGLQADSHESVWQGLRTYGWKRQGLVTGDFLIWTSQTSFWLVERKTLADLLASIISGRMKDQAVRMAEASNRPILLLEGPWNRLVDDSLLGHLGWKWIQVWLYILGIQDDGPRIVMTTSASHSVEMLLALEKTAHSGLVSKSRQRLFSGSPGLGTLTSVKGVGPEKAKAIMASFKAMGRSNLRAVANASMEELMEIPGVGPELAARLEEFWGKEF